MVPLIGETSSLLPPPNGTRSLVLSLFPVSWEGAMDLMTPWVRSLLGALLVVIYLSWGEEEVKQVLLERPLD